MRVVYFLKNFLFCDTCFYATVQKFRLLYCYTVTCNMPDYDIKSPGKVRFWLVRLIWERQMFVITGSLRHLKYWVGVHWGQSYLMGRRCLFSLGWPPF